MQKISMMMNINLTRTVVHVPLILSLFIVVLIPHVNAATLTDAVNQAKKSSSQGPGYVDSRIEELLHKDINTTLEVPPVYKRPLGVDAGSRIYVRKFIVTGVYDYPEFGITQEIVNNLVEELRVKFQNLDVMNVHGLTKEDIDAVGKQLQETLYNNKNNLESNEKFLEKLREDKKYREEMSIGQLQEVANKITDLYRSSGFVIAQAYIPEQTVQEGIVYIQVQEGILGNIIVTDNNDYTTDKILEKFNHLKGKTVRKESVESALLALTDYPGLVAYGVLQPGETTGETDLLVKVQEEIRHEYTARVDNYGSDETGNVRITFTYANNNIFKNADDLTVNLLQSFSPANTLYGGVEYKSPITNTDMILGVSTSSNAFDVGGSLVNFDVNGTVLSTDLFVSHQFVRSRNTNVYGKLKLNNKAAVTKISNITLSEDTLTSLVFETGFDILDKKYKGINQGMLSLTQGFEGLIGALEEGDSSSRLGGSGKFATGDFTKLNWSLARLQLINKYQNVLVRFSGQLSNDLLVPVEQSGMGGPSNVRAFPVSEYLRDSSVFLSADWNFNAPFFYDVPAFDNWKWGEVLQFSLFIDGARGSLNDPLASDNENIDLSGYGVAAQLLIPGKLQIRLDIAQPLKDPETDPLLKQDLIFYFTLSYTG